MWVCVTHSYLNLLAADVCTYKMFVVFVDYTKWGLLRLPNNHLSISPPFVHSIMPNTTPTESDSLKIDLYYCNKNQLSSSGGL